LIKNQGVTRALKQSQTGSKNNAQYSVAKHHVRRKYPNSNLNWCAMRHFKSLSNCEVLDQIKKSAQTHWCQVTIAKIRRKLRATAGEPTTVGVCHRNHPLRSAEALSKNCQHLYCNRLVTTGMSQLLESFPRVL